MTSRFSPTRRGVLAIGAGAALALVSRPLLAQGAPELRIGTGFGLSFFPVRLAELKGFYARHAKAVGIPDMKVSLLSLSGNSAMNDGILSGSIDLCIAAIPGLLLLQEKTRGPDKVVGYSGLSNLPGVLLAVDPRLKSLGDFGPEDKISTPSMLGINAFLIRMAAEKELGDHRKLDNNMVNLPNAEAVNALLTGSIAANLTSVPFIQVIEKDKRAHRIFDSKSVFGSPTSWVIVAGKQSFATAKPAVAEVYMRAMKETLEFMKSEPAETAKLYLQTEPSKVLNEAAVTDLLRNPENGYSMEALGVMGHAAFLKRAGVIKSEPASANDFMSPIAHGLKNT